MDEGTRDVDRLAHRWFVRYNPLYFFSALSVLCGVFLLSRGLDEIGWREGKILLTVVLEIYQLLLVGAAALLYRVARQQRPAVILGLLAVVFFFDATFQTEALASVESPGTAAAWAGLKALELVILFWALRLRPSPAAIATPLIAIALIAATPHLLDSSTAERLNRHLLATWVAAGLALWFLDKRPVVVSLRRLNHQGEVVLKRSETAARRIWLGFLLLHLTGWMLIYDVPLSWAHVTPWLVFTALRAREEVHVWIAALSAAGLALTHPPTAAPAMLAVASVLAWRAWRQGQHRLLIGSVVALYMASWTAGWQGGPLPEPAMWAGLTAAVLLILLAWRLRLPAALAPLVAALPELHKRLPELTAMQWGALLLALGFVSLLAGVALDWRSPRKQTQ